MAKNKKKTCKQVCTKYSKQILPDQRKRKSKEEKTETQGISEKLI